MAEGTAWVGPVLLLCFGFLGGIKVYVGGRCAGSSRERDREVLSHPEHEICAWEQTAWRQSPCPPEFYLFHLKQFTMRDERARTGMCARLVESLSTISS